MQLRRYFPPRSQVELGNEGKIERFVNRGPILNGTANILWPPPGGRRPPKKDAFGVEGIPLAVLAPALGTVPAYLRAVRGRGT